MIAFLQGWCGNNKTMTWLTLYNAFIVSRCTKSVNNSNYCIATSWCKDRNSLVFLAMDRPLRYVCVGGPCEAAMDECGMLAKRKERRNGPWWCCTVLMGAAALFGAKYVDTPPRQTAGNALNWVLCVCGAELSMSRGVVVKITKLGCQSLVRGSAPRVLLFVQKRAWMTRCEIERTWCQSSIRCMTPNGLVVVFGIYCGWKRGRVPHPRRWNVQIHSFLIQWHAIGIEIALFGRIVAMSEFYMCQNLVCTGRGPPPGVFPNILAGDFCSNFGHIPKLHVPPNTTQSMVSETCAQIMMENITYLSNLRNSCFFSPNNWRRNITDTVISHTTENLWKSCCRPSDTKWKKGFENRLICNILKTCHFCTPFSALGCEIAMQGHALFRNGYNKFIQK